MAPPFSDNLSGVSGCSALCSLEGSSALQFCKALSLSLLTEADLGLGLGQLNVKFAMQSQLSALVRGKNSYCLTLRPQVTHSQ